LEQPFSKNIYVTPHAQERMIKRNITETRLVDLIETGQIKYKDQERLWIFKHYPDRLDNLLCVAATSGQALLIKTVMINWQLLE